MDFNKAETYEINSLIEKFGRLDIENDENAYQIFEHIGILDVYERSLTEKEAAELLTSFKDHNIKYESNFIRFFDSAFKINDKNPVYVHVSLPFSDQPFKNLALLSLIVDLNKRKTILIICQLILNYRVI